VIVDRRTPANYAEISPANVAGLVVGEGCFYAESCADPKYRLGWRVRPAFCIEMRADERDVLEEVRRHLGCGQIYELDFGRYRGYEMKNWHKHAKLRVSSVRDLQEGVVPFFKANSLFGRKRAAFEIFSELVELLHAKQHRDCDGLARAKDLAHRLALHNARGASSEITGSTNAVRSGRLGRSREAVGRPKATSS
jgi:hypothetical protein